MATFKSCHGCTERTPGCHSKCEKYIKERAEYDRIQELKKGTDIAYREYRRYNMGKTMDAHAMRKKKNRSYGCMGGN